VHQLTSENNGTRHIWITKSNRKQIKIHSIIFSLDHSAFKALSNAETDTNAELVSDTDSIIHEVYLVI